jgi:predicted NAD/FAD-binding protein
VTMNLMRFLQGAGHVWYAGAHTLMNSQEHCFVSGLAAARQIGADYPFADAEARKWFNFYGGLLHGFRFRRA